MEERKNLANTIDEPPFDAYAVTAHYLRFQWTEDRHRSSSLDTEGQEIPDLFVAGKPVGGLFYFNYPGGPGLMTGLVTEKFPARLPNAGPHNSRDDEKLLGSQMRVAGRLFSDESGRCVVALLISCFRLMSTRMFICSLCGQV